MNSGGKLNSLSIKAKDNEVELLGEFVVIGVMFGFSFPNVEILCEFVPTFFSFVYFSDNFYTIQLVKVLCKNES